MAEMQKYTDNIRELKRVEHQLEQWISIFESIVEVLQGKEKRITRLQGPNFHRKFFFQGGGQPTFDYERLPSAEEIIDALDERDRLTQAIASFDQQIDEARKQS